ncbi:hypothetical protein Tco_0827256, partial [Tanacetum coccineum]
GIELSFKIDLMPFSLFDFNMDKENPYNENNRYKLCLQIEATFSGAKEKETTSKSAPLKQLPPGMIKEGMNLTNEKRGVVMHAIGCAVIM